MSRKRIPRQPTLLYHTDPDFLNKVADFVSNYFHDEDESVCCLFAFFSRLPKTQKTPSKDNPDDLLMCNLEKVLRARDIPEIKSVTTKLTEQGMEKELLTAEYKYSLIYDLLT